MSRKAYGIEYYRNDSSEFEAEIFKYEGGKPTDKYKYYVSHGKYPVHLLLFDSKINYQIQYRRQYGKHGRSKRKIKANFSVAEIILYERHLILPPVCRIVLSVCRIILF